MTDRPLVVDAGKRNSTKSTRSRKSPADLESLQAELEKIDKQRKAIEDAIIERAWDLKRPH